MNLTTATPIRFTISNSTMDSDYVTSRPPTKKRVNQKSSLVKKAKNVKETSFFKPANEGKTNLYKEPFEVVSGTLWALEYSINGVYSMLNDSLTTKELKSFVNSEEILVARAAQAIIHIDNTLALAESHANKYASYSLSYNILELQQAIYKTKVFEDTEIGSIAKFYIEVLYADQLADNAKHTAREAFAAKFNRNEASLIYLNTIGII